MRNKHPKPGYLGPAFHEWLEWLEYVECITLSKKRPGKPFKMSMADRLFRVEDDKEFQKMMNDAAPVDAWLASCVRSSVKYKVKAETLALMVHQYGDELRYIRETRPIHLPHEWCTLVVEDYGKDTFLICLQETETNHGGDYPELGVTGQDKWISSNICFYRNEGVELMSDSKIHPEQRLSYCPVEQHFNLGEVWGETTWLNAVADGVKVTKIGERTLELCKAVTMAWIESFHLASVLRHKTVGIPPSSKAFIPKKRRKKRTMPQFEHIIVELPINNPESSQTGRSVFQPKKRLHQVRGFMRHYRTGKTVWVKPHWRGDEHLGVIKHDFEMTLDERRTP